MKALDALIEFGAVAVIGVLVLAFYQRSVAARYAASQSAADAQLTANAGNAVLGALFGWQQPAGQQINLGL